MFSESIKWAEQLREEGIYRPCVSTIVYRQNPNAESEILVVQSAKGGNWLFSQEGVEEREIPLQAHLRGLREEIGINPEELSFGDLGWIGFYRGNLDAPESRADKRGFSNGKGYSFSVFSYTGGDRNFVLQEGEVSGVAWVEHSKIGNYLNTSRSEKAILMEGALERAIEIVSVRYPMVFDNGKPKSF